MKVCVVEVVVAVVVVEEHAAPAVQLRRLAVL
jgi:hypothetical protein